jgi:hypothetical protein
VRWLFGGFVAFWVLLASFGAWFLVYGWTLTDHQAVRPNENILQLSPVMLPMIVLVPLAAGRRKRRIRAARAGLVLTGFMLAGSIIGFVLQVLPGLDQVNGNIIALALPANAGLAWAMWRIDTHLRRIAAAQTVERKAKR